MLWQFPDSYHLLSGVYMYMYIYIAYCMRKVTHKSDRFGYACMMLTDHPSARRVIGRIQDQKQKLHLEVTLPW